MELPLLGFYFGKKKDENKKSLQQASPVQAITAPEVYDGTVTIEAGGFFGTALDYAASTRDETQSIIMYRNMSVYPELDNAIDEIVNASIVQGTDHKPVKLDSYRIEFEGKFNWDCIFNFDNDTHCLNGRDCCSVEFDIHQLFVFSEIKPLLGDDYPCVLRKMKNQIELTKKQIDLLIPLLEKM